MPEKKMVIILAVIAIILTGSFLAYRFNFGTTASLALDGTCSNYGQSVTSISCSLTTSSSTDVIIVFCGTANYNAVISVSGGSLTWNTRVNPYKISQTVSGTLNNFAQMAEFYSTTTGALSSASLTCSFSASDNQRIIAFGISGANTASPFDSNSILPGENQGASNFPSVSISTSNSHDFIFGLLMSQTATPTVGSGFTSIASDVPPPTGIQPISAEYEVVSSVQSASSVSYSLSSSVIWGMIGDAVVAGSSGGGGGGGTTSTITSSATTQRVSTSNSQQTGSTTATAKIEFPNLSTVQKFVESSSGLEIIIAAAIIALGLGYYFNSKRK